MLGAAPALIVALPAAYVVARAAYLASFTTLGRDQGIFQYIAWAMTQGDVDYRDVRDVNGPLIHGLHRLLFVLGGADEHRFRILDLVISFSVFGLAGAAVPGAGPNRAPPSMLQRASFGLLAAVLLGGQYLRYLAWDLAQRESMCDWFVLGAAAAFAWEKGRPRRFFVAGLLLGLACFGKPTYVVFAFFGALQTLVLPGEGESRKRNLLRYAAGALSSAVLALVYLASVGDVGAFLRIYLVDAPRMYAFIWPHTARELMELGWVAHPAKIGAAAAGLGALLALVRVLPRRAWFVVAMPVGGLVSVYLQKKGFPYHLHPVTAGAALIGVASFGALVDALRAPDAPKRRLRNLWAVLTVGLGVFLAVHEVAAMRGSPHLMNPWTAELGASPEGRISKAYLDRFKMWDFFPYEMRETADYLKAHTAPDARVQLYGMDPYVLFLAERRSASPYIYAYDLNTDAAFNGAMETLPVPKNEAAAAVIRDMGDAHARDLLERLGAHPPAAWVLFDHAPLSSYETGKEDLEKTQPAVFAFLAARYREEANFGEIHVYLPRTVP